MAVYIAGMFCVKCSILMLYNRIFRVLALQKTLIALGVMVLIWALTAFFCSVFLCYPIAFNWDPTIKGRCIDYGKVTLVIGIFNIFLDFALLTVPMPSVWKLNMSTRRKFLVSLIFAAGCWWVFIISLTIIVDLLVIYSACVVSIARLFYARRVASTYDPTCKDPGPCSDATVNEYCNRGQRHGKRSLATRDIHRHSRLLHNHVPTAHREDLRQRKDKE
jgi:hypothetical protein